MMIPATVASGPVAGFGHQPLAMIRRTEVLPIPNRRAISEWFTRSVLSLGPAFQTMERRGLLLAFGPDVCADDRVGLTFEGGAEARVQRCG
jgi:hypothetical protein